MFALSKMTFPVSSVVLLILLVSICGFQAQLKRAELQRDRSRAAFVAAKLRQQGKIKSKR